MKVTGNGESPPTRWACHPQLSILPSHTSHQIQHFTIMKKSFLSLILALVGFGALTTSCEDMLTPDIDRYAENFSGRDTVNFYFGILRNLQGVVEQNVLLGELRGDLVTATEYTNDSINNIINFRDLSDGSSELLNRAAYYKVINQCNFYLSKVDSMALKNNSYYMRRELAQVQLVRAWTYLQLVQQYGSVPFITAPVSSASTGWEQNPPLGFATPDNLLKLLEDHGGLKQAYAYSNGLGYINYPNFKTGAGDFAQPLTVFNGDLVYGDLYLLRGASKDDYEQAATHFHRFLDRGTKLGVTKVAAATRRSGDRSDLFDAASDWFSLYENSNVVKQGQVVTAMPSAANSFFGKVLSRIPQIYGFDASSTTSRDTKESTGTDGKKKEETSSSGQVVLAPNYRNRQVQPANAYLKLNESQVFVYNEFEKDSRNTVKEVKYPELGDIRANQSAPIIITEGGQLRFIQKFNMASNAPDGAYLRSLPEFTYGIPVYTLRRVYLKYAEAINRAGFPRMAFDVLRSGLSLENLPREVQREFTDTVYTDDTKKDIAKVSTLTVPWLVGGINGDKSVGMSTVIRASDKKYLDFSTFTNKDNEGIHAAGCGRFLDADTIWVYEKVVAQRIVDEAARQGVAISKPTLSEKIKVRIDSTKIRVEKAATEAGDEYDQVSLSGILTLSEPTQAEIAAVETIIADEMALDNAFEGHRYFDLMRIQRHRNNAGDEKVPNSWMAWLISRRDLELKPYEQPTKTGNFYDRFVSGNWYLPAPKARY